MISELSVQYQCSLPQLSWSLVLNLSSPIKFLNMNAGLQNQMPFILMDVSYIIFLEMKKFQLGPHMNLYKIGF